MRSDSLLIHPIPLSYAHTGRSSTPDWARLLEPGTLHRTLQRLPLIRQGPVVGAADRYVGFWCKPPATVAFSVAGVQKLEVPGQEAARAAI